jgi:hypothetical protein
MSSAFEDDLEEYLKDPEFRAVYYETRDTMAQGKINFLEAIKKYLEEKNEYLRSLITEWAEAEARAKFSYARPEVYARLRRAEEALRKEIGQ